MIRFRLRRNKRILVCLFAGGWIWSVNAGFAQEPIAHGLHDLVVYDPGVHERGLPSPELVEGGKVDIPPAVHVHRFYYSGDKEIQGPIISGGPTVVVASHPKTGKRMYVEVVLPAGAPRIAYNKHGITYVYPDKRVSVNFQHFPFDTEKAVVKVQNGQGIGRRLQDSREHVSEHVKEGLANSPIFQSSKEATGEASDLLHGAKVTVGDLGSKGADGFKTLTNMIPGVVYLKSRAEQEPEKDYESAIKAAANKKDRLEIPFVRTNR